ncbi:hypothetical protein [Azospirillum sp. B4]|uniref:hypothetical protein n=1 Tax=Azospirillum sp. B4 TaxID=95605 RepID=UPI00034B0E4F|nr:hypothetical protein [Azospirillum sp. B4]
MVRNDVLVDRQDAERGPSVIERIEDALVSVNPDFWLVGAVLVVAIRCLGGLA